MWRSVVRATGLAVVLLAACGDDSTSNPSGPKDAVIDASPDSPGPGTGSVAPCFDQSEVAKPPDGQLPCELMSPEFKR